MIATLSELVASGRPAAASIDAFIATNRFPIVDPTGVTFVFRGEADAVLLRCFIHGLPTAQPLEPIAETDLWVLRIELPANSRIEYKFEVVRGSGNELITDPLNPVRAADPFGANSVCQGYGYETPGWTLHDPQARVGALEELQLSSEALGSKRRLLIYVPARFRRSRRYPLLIAHDGEDYVRFAHLKTVLDNLIHRLEIPPMIVCLTQSPDRLMEYAGHNNHARFLAEEVLPLVRSRYPLMDEPGGRGLMGASFGAVASLHAAWRYPALFGRLLLQSGSFAFSDIGHHRRGPVFDPVARFVNEFRASPGRPADRMYLSCGIYESLIYENRSLVPLLNAQGIEVRYEEVRDGHNWQNWRDRLRTGLSWLFPGPLWMVYE
ncbi:MAG TPA: alpha/beta hydrolase-fold protein [Steroidobacteraceae bacterium]|jgi:enterochelin esterase family protein|nr:alpha/beta hydrolase-fold protein [Steroidobacteraceae bacterium]